MLKILIATVIVSILFAVALAPVAGVSSIAIARTNEAMESDIDDLEAGNIPGVTTIKDAQGNDMAYLFNQRRHPVTGDQISQSMKDAIVSIEDRRFYEHDGVDFQGNFRAMVTNVLAGGVSQGASTINQQYVKNYLLLVSAKTDEERAAATEQSIPRKLREIRMAVEIDKKLDKDEILTNYLNLVPFGNYAYGVEAAARTYFGKSAKDLNVRESAMLAGMVQSSEFLNPYTNEQAVIDRRNLVLQAMVSTGAITQAIADEEAAQPLGVLETPQTLANGCIGAGDRGFFCDYALSYLEERGISTDELARGGYVIETTLDPAVQDSAKAAVNEMTPPDTAGVAEVMNVLEPSPTSRKVLAMVSSRSYGLNLENNETILPQPYSMVGNGAGSIFKVFTAAAAIKGGYGIKDQLDVPRRYEAEGLGRGGAENCPADKYCVENAGSYQPSMSLESALANSPNTTFVKLEEQVGIDAVVDMAVDLGLRSYTDDNSYGNGNSIAQFAKDAPMGAFTLGPTAINPLELSNVGATIASGGNWCEPNPITKITDRNGHEVYVESTPCESVLDRGVADALANAMSQDITNGTAAQAANQFGYSGQLAAKTGTTESNQSAAFLGFNSAVAAAPYIYNDGTSTSPLCTSPVRQCGSGTLFGGTEPARTFFSLANKWAPAANGNIAPYDPAYDDGKSDPLLESLRGKTEAEARSILEGEGYRVKVSQVRGNELPAGRVVRAVTGAEGMQQGAEITVQLSDGTGFAPPAPAGENPDGGATATANPGPANGNNPSAPPRRNPGQGRPNQAPPPLISQQDIDNLTNELRNAFGL